MKKTIFLILFVLALFAVMPFSAYAIPVSLGTAGEFNTFIFNDFTGSSDTEGRLAVGGNASLSSYSVGDKLEPGQHEDILIVGEDLTVSGGRVYFGNIVVGGEANMPGYDVADGELLTNQDELPIDFAAEEAYIKSLSAELSQESGNGNVEKQWGGIYLTGNGTDDTQIFNLDGSDLLAAHTFQASNINEDATVIFNVSGDLAGLTNMSMNSLLPIRNNVLFNFYEATSLTLGGISVEGSILAPFANVINPMGVINGTIIANSWNGSMQQNHQPFNSTDDNSSPAPEPGTVFLFISGIAIAAGIRKVRNK